MFLFAASLALICFSSASKPHAFFVMSFKFHSAPEIKPGTAGFFLVPPSVFNIEFYYNGEKNPNLPLLSDCVLTGIEVDYSPNGWASYEVPGKNSPDVGGTGAPVATRLTLSFKETVILTKGLHQPDQKNYNSRVNRKWQNTLLIFLLLIIAYLNIVLMWMLLLIYWFVLKWKIV